MLIYLFCYDVSPHNSHSFPALIYSLSMKTCITCGMPLTGNHANDIGLELPEGPVCKFDSENGKVKSAEAIFEGGIVFFAEETTDGDRELAERLTRKNMHSLSYWKTHPFKKLEGTEATDAEFETAMAKL